MHMNTLIFIFSFDCLASLLPLLMSMVQRSTPLYPRQTACRKVRAHAQNSAEELRHEISRLAHVRVQLEQVAGSLNTHSPSSIGNEGAAVVEEAEQDQNGKRSTGASSSEPTELHAMLRNAQAEAAKQRQRAERAEAELARLRAHVGALPHAPVLEEGSEDVYYVAKLQQCLERAGYGVGDDELDEIFFGPCTLEALLTFQACSGLSETGRTDPETWAALLDPTDIRADGTVAPPENGDDGSGAVEADANDAAGMLGSSAIALAAGADGNIGTADASSGTYTLEQAVSQLGFPEIAPGESRREVRGILRALERVGFASADIDAELAELGEASQETLRWFHASCGLPESAHVSASTISHLLYREEIATGPESLTNLASEKERELGMDPQEEESGGASNANRVYLLAEGRYEQATEGGRI